MEHKAFSFDWNSFSRHLGPILFDALKSNSVGELTAFIDHHKASLTDPYEGESLPDDWRAELENGDVHELGDIALTLYYSPSSDVGIGAAWVMASDDPSLAKHLLGAPFGPSENYFDPGRMGSYFQSPDDVVTSLRDAPNFAENIDDFVNLLKYCAVKSLGVYVTF